MVSMERAGEAVQKHWINGIVGGLALTALGFQVPPFHNQVHPHEGPDAVRALERRVAALEWDNKLLRAQLDFYITGEVDFLGSRALMRSMPLVGAGAEEDAAEMMEEAAEEEGEGATPPPD